MYQGTLKEYVLEGYRISGGQYTSGSKSLSYDIPLFTLYDDPATQAYLMTINFNQAASANRGSASITTSLSTDNQDIIITYSSSQNCNYLTLGNIPDTSYVHLYSYGSFETDYAASCELKDLRLVYIVP